MPNNKRGDTKKQNPQKQPSSGSQPVKPRQTKPQSSNSPSASIDVEATNVNIVEPHAQNEAHHDENALFDQIKKSEKWMIVLTVALAVVAALQLAVAALQWRTMEKSDQTLRKTIEATQRPWVKVTDMAVIQDEDLKRGKNWSLKIRLGLQNVGNGVALTIETFGAIITDNNLDQSRRFSFLDKNQEMLCTGAKKEYSSTHILAGTSIFPSDLGFDIAVPRSLSEFDDTESNNIFLVGCVTYNSVFAEVPYQTAFVYKISLEPTAEQKSALATEQTITIKAGAIRLHRAHFHDRAQ